MKSSEIKRLVIEAGAVAAGIAEAAPVEPWAEEMYQRVLSDGSFGTMDYMSRYQEVRHDPRLLLEGARSIIVAAFSYKPDAGWEAQNSQNRLHWARYALGRDYHEEIRNRLGQVAATITAATGAECRVTVDTAPLRERYWAVKAGVGFIGINNQLIVPGAGSWCLLGEIITTLPLGADEPCRLSCEGCMRCVRACPGGALDGCGRLDARRCMSYLTIESKVWDKNITLKGGRIYGCDVCQEVCPHNAGVPATRIEGFRPRQAIMSLTRDDILSMEQAEFSRIFTHSAIKRAKLAGLQRNARAIDPEETQPE